MNSWKKLRTDLLIHDLKPNTLTENTQSILWCLTYLNISFIEANLRDYSWNNPGAEFIGLQVKALNSCIGLWISCLWSTTFTFPHFDLSQGNVKEHKRPQTSPNIGSKLNSKPFVLKCDVLLLNFIARRNQGIKFLGKVVFSFSIWKWRNPISHNICLLVGFPKRVVWLKILE